MASTRYKLQRYKFQRYETGEYDINLWRTDDDRMTNFCKKKVEVIGRKCLVPGDYAYIKYLDTEGQYRFITFDRFLTYQQNDEPIGQVSRLVTSLENAGSNTNGLGYVTSKQLMLSTKVTKEQYQEYIEVLQSPRVYLQKDTEDLLDEDKNWILVNVSSSSTQYNSKKPRETFSIVVTLPETNNIIM